MGTYLFASRLKEIDDDGFVIVFQSNLQEASSKSASVEVFSPVSLLTLNVILRCAFSYDEDVQTSR